MSTCLLAWLANSIAACLLVGLAGHSIADSLLVLTPHVGLRLEAHANKISSCVSRYANGTRILVRFLSASSRSRAGTDPSVSIPELPEHLGPSCWS